MNWNGREAEEWMKALDEDGDERHSGSSVSELSPQEEARVRHLAALIEKKPVSNRKSRTWLAAGAGMSVAAAAAVWLTMSGTTPAPPAVTAMASLNGPGAATLERSGKRSDASLQDSLLPGDTIHASGDISLKFGEGARAQLQGSTSVTLMKTETTEGVRLDSGRVALQIPKQAPGKTWRVTTGNTTVTVVGTAFAVWLADDRGAHVTCVSVSEGQVRAESSAHSSMLHPGDVWSSAPESKVCSPQEKRIEEAPEPPPNEPSEPPRVAPPKKQPLESSLAVQNQLYLEMVQARRNGETDRAQRLGQSFLSKYPRSPFAGQVRAELKKN